MAGVLLEARSYRPFKSSEEYLYAMKEDLAEWLNTLYPELNLNVDNFMDKLETGVILCKHANNVRKQAQEYLARKQIKRTLSIVGMTQSILSKRALPIVEMGECSFKPSAKPGTFFARDNVSNFIDFARKGLEILECLLFETEDLIMRKNEKNVILCLLEVARRGAKYGMLAPILVQMEREIDRELAAERGEVVPSSDDDDDDDNVPRKLGPITPIPQIVTNDLKSLDEMVRELVEMCSCPTQFPMIRVAEGKYRIGDTKVLIFVRILRSHVMVRVGGGWDTLEHYLDKHDPCRCRTSHKSALSSKVIQKNPVPYELNNAFVHYERSPPRTRRSSASSTSSEHGGRESRDFSRDLLTASPQPQLRNRSRSPTPRLQLPRYVATFNIGSPRYRSASPNPKEPPASPRRSQSRSGYDAPTAASRNRSRSPSVRNPGDVPLPLDSSSEVSDEGYRSLGRTINTRIVGKPSLTDNNHPSLDFEKPTLKEGSLSGSCSEINDSRRTSREASVDSNCHSSPDRRRRSSIGSEINRMTRSRSVSSGDGSPRKLSSSSADKPFQRGTTTRGSLPANRRRNKQVSPLMSDLIHVQNLEDDKLILEKMKELISQYSGILEKTDESSELWNSQDSCEEDKTPHRRKDSKYEGTLSKIPAPVFYKQPSSEKEC